MLSNAGTDRSITGEHHGMMKGASPADSLRMFTEIQIPGCHPRPTESESLRDRGSGFCTLNKLFKRFCGASTVETVLEAGPEKS